MAYIHVDTSVDQIREFISGRTSARAGQIDQPPPIWSNHFMYFFFNGLWWVI